MWLIMRDAKSIFVLCANDDLAVLYGRSGESLTRDKIVAVILEGE